MAYVTDYLSASEFKAYKYVSDTADDTEIGWAVTAASRTVDTFTGRRFGKVAQAEERSFRLYPDLRRGRLVANIDDVQDTDDLVVKVDGTVTTDFTLEPGNALAHDMPYTRIVLGSSHTRGCEVAVTAWWGWDSVPTTVKQATALQATRYLSRRQSPFGIVTAPAEGAEAFRLLQRADPDVAVMLSGYVRRRAVG